MLNQELVPHATMKILFFIGSLRSGGAERVAVTLVEAFTKELKWEVILVTGDHIHNDFYHSDAVTRKSLEFNYQKNRNPIEQFRRIIRTRNYINEEDADILVFSSISFALRGLISSIGLGIPTIVCEHNNYFGLKSRLKRQLRNLLYPLASRIFLLTNRDLSNYANRVRRRCVVVPNPLGLSGKWVKHSFKYQLLAVGRLTEQKAFHRLLDVLYLLPDIYTLTVLGEGELKSTLAKKAEELGIASRVTFVGATKDIGPYYEQANILVMTSIYEGLPLVILEANAYALPVISYDCDTGPREMIVDGVNGYLIAEGDSDAMVDKITKLSNDEHLYKRMCDDAFKYSKRYSIGKILNYWKKQTNCILNPGNS